MVRMSAQILDSTNPKVKEYLAKIGEIIVTFNFLESQMDFYIQELVKPVHSHAGLSQRVGKRITTMLEFSQKTDLLLSLIIERSGKDEGTRFKSIYNALGKMAEKRNDVAHSQWFLEYGNIQEGVQPSTHKINEQKGIKFNKEANFEQAIKEVTIEELQTFIEEMLQMVSDIHAFFLPAPQTTK